MPVDEPAKYEITCTCGTSFATITIWVVDIELTLGSDEIYVNTDDDNGTTVSDLTESPVDGENDLTFLHTAIVPSDAPIMIDSIVTVWGSGGVALWEDDQKASASPGMWYYTCPDELWVEGTSVSTNPGDRTITLHCVADCDSWWWYCEPLSTTPAGRWARRLKSRTSTWARTRAPGYRQTGPRPPTALLTTSSGTRTGKRPNVWYSVFWAEISRGKTVAAASLATHRASKKKWHYNSSANPRMLGENQSLKP